VADYEDLVDLVRPHAIEAPLPSIISSIRRATIKLCRDSHIWREWLDVKVSTGDKTVRLRPRSGRVEAIREAVYEDSQIGRRSLSQANWGDLVYPERQTDTRPTHYALSPDHSKIGFFPTIMADAAQGPVVHTYLLLVPERSGDSFPDWIDEEWQEAIVHGALYYLYRTPRKPWSSQPRAAAERFEFMTGINQASRETRTDNWAPTMTKMRKWI